VQALEMPYKEDDISMYVLLPEQRDGLKKILKSSQVEQQVKAVIKDLEKEIPEEKMNVWMPKFKVETSYSLQSALSSIGINKIFSGQADLSGINGRKDLQVTQIKHKAVVRVDEEGTEAAAVTSIEVGTTSLGDNARATDFRADHPFLFLIKDKATGTVLFIGKVEEL